MMFGMKIVESVHATTKPKGRPFTDDMIAFVEHMERLGLIQRLPAAYQLGANTIVMHPTLAAKMRREMQRKALDIERRVFYGGSFV